MYAKKKLVFVAVTTVDEIYVSLITKKESWWQLDELPPSNLGLYFLLHIFPPKPLCDFYRETSLGRLLSPLLCQPNPGQEFAAMPVHMQMQRKLL